MKINIELDSTLNEIELVIKTPDLNNDVALIKDLVEKALTKNQKIVFYKEDTEYFIPLNNILFFETDDSKVMHIQKIISLKSSSNSMNSKILFHIIIVEFLKVQ